MKRTELILIIAGLLLVAVFGYVSINKSAEMKVDDSVPLPTDSFPGDDVEEPVETIDTSQKDGWLTQTTSRYSVQYPAEATIDQREKETIMYYMGERQIASGRTQTELFDGYSVRIAEIEDDITLDLLSFAQEQLDNAESNCDYENGVVAGLTAVTIGGQPGYQYSAQNCYIDYTETIVLSDGIYYRVSQTYVGEPDVYEMYKEISNEIVSSIVFQ